MDPVLAELYGTVEPQEDIEKTAQLDLLQKVAEAHDIDLDALTEEQILEAAAELNDFGQEKTAADELFQNSEYAGKIMAHSMVNELRGIQKAAEYDYSNPLLEAVMLEKEAGPKIDAVKGFFQRVGSGIKERAGAAAARASAPAERGAGILRTARENVQAGAAKGMREGIQQAKGLNPEILRREGAEVLKEVGKKAKKPAMVAAGLTAAGGTAYGGKKVYDRMKKKSFDEAVYERAAEHLAAAGLVDDYGDILPPEYAEKTAQDVDATALGLLQEMGYPVEWY